MTKPTRWGIVTTLNAPLPHVQAFVAHHLGLGASRIWLHFDNPTNPAIAAFKGHAKVVAVRCDEAYWHEVAGTRPDTHQVRQVKNCTRVLRRAKLDFIAHIDVDEFLLPKARSIAEVLNDCASNQLILRVEPWEALHDEGLPDDIFTAHHFRRQLPLTPAEARSLYGPQGPLLERGMLSHTVGKCFFRTRVPGFVGRIHGARLNGHIVPGGPFSPEIALLHFHAHSRLEWLDRLDFRLAKGAYQYRPEMREWLLNASKEDIAAFYTQIQAARPELLAVLKDRGALMTASLGLREKIAVYQDIASMTPNSPEGGTGA